MTGTDRHLAEIAREAMGGTGALARACQVSRRSVERWISGETPVTGTTRVALLQIVKHPGEFAHCRNDRGAGRAGGPPK